MCVGGGGGQGGLFLKFLWKFNLWGGGLVGVSEGGSGLGCQGGCERRIEVYLFCFFLLFFFFFLGGGSGRGSDCGGGVRVDGRFCGNSFFWGGEVGLGGQGGRERRIEVVVKNQKKYFFWGGGWSGLGVSGGSGRVWGGCQGGCGRRIEVFVKIQKKMEGVGLGGGGCRVGKEG